MSMTEELLHSLVIALHGTPQVEINGTLVDFTPPFRRVDFATALESATSVGLWCFVPKFWVFP